MSTFPLIYFEQFTKNKEYKTFCVNKSQKTIRINDTEVDMDVLKEIVNEESLEKFFETLNFIKSERTTINETTETFDVIISNTFPEDGPHELHVKIDYNDGNSGYSPVVISDLQEAITETWNNLFKDCLMVSFESNYMILKTVSKLYRSRKSNASLLMSFHDFTMNILRAPELTPLESAYKEFIEEIFICRSRNENGLVLFDGITMSRNECYLRIMFYKRLTDINTAIPAYQPTIIKFGKFNGLAIGDCSLTIANIADDSGMTKVKDVINIFD